MKSISGTCMRRYGAMLVVVVLGATLAMAEAMAGAEAPADRWEIEGLPFAIRRLDSSPISTGPRVFFDTAQVAEARRRAASRPGDKATLERYLEKMGEHLDLAIEPLDESWWESIRDKPWGETYPIIFERTMREPMRYAHAAGDLATAWLLTGDEKYAERAEALLMNLTGYQFLAEHYDVGMNYSIWVWQALIAYDTLFPRLSTGQRDKLDGMVTRFVRALGKNDVFWIENNIGGGINNHLAWHKVLFGLVGLFYDRPEMVKECLYGRRGLVSLLEDGLLDHGLWCESSLNYQFTAIAPMLIFGQCQKNVRHEPSILNLVAADGRTLKQSFDAMFDVLAPNGLIPPIGDAYARHVRLSEIHLYEAAWDAWGDPKYAWLMNQNPEPSIRSLFVPEMPSNVPAPPIRTLNLPEHGYVFLRSHEDEAYWNTDARMAFLTYDRSDVHANADKLSLMLFAGDHMVLPDVEGRATVPHAFSSRIQSELNRGTLSHNTVMIDGQDQRMVPRMLRLIEFRDVPDEKRATAADLDDILYDGVRQMRTIAMTDDYVLDVFQVDTGEVARQIDWIVHTLDEHARMVDSGPLDFAGAETYTFGDQGPGRWLRDGRVLVPAGDLRMTWANEATSLQLTMLDPEADQLIVCGYPATDEPDSGMIPMMILRRQASRALFAGVWVVGDGPSEVSILRLASRENRLQFEVKVDGRARRHFVPDLQHITP